MNDMYFTFRSLTTAQRGQTACLDHAISVSLLRTPRSLSDRGCGYALRVSPSVAGQVSLILRLEQIPYEHVYRLQVGEAEEVAL